MQLQLIKNIIELAIINGENKKRTSYLISKAKVDYYDDK
jgi:hypothetical protein